MATKIQTQAHPATDSNALNYIYITSGIIQSINPIPNTHPISTPPPMHPTPKALPTHPAATINP